MLGPVYHSRIAHLTRVKWSDPSVEGDYKRCREYINLTANLTWRCVRKNNHKGWCRHDADGLWAKILWDPKKMGI